MKVLSEWVSGMLSAFLFCYGGLESSGIILGVSTRATGL